MGEPNFIRAPTLSNMVPLNPFQSEFNRKMTPTAKRMFLFLIVNAPAVNTLEGVWKLPVALLMPVNVAKLLAPSWKATWRS